MTAEPARRGLGRGLEVLLGAAAANAADVREIPVADIRPNPRQPRSTVGDDGALVESVRAQGIVQPVIVRELGEGRFELIAGERRWRAARAAGLATIPALVRAADDRESLLLALVENVARRQLTSVEEARAYSVLLDEFGLTLSDVAERVGRSKPGVSNRLRLLELPDDILALVAAGTLSEAHARAVLAVPDHDGRRRLARRIAREGLSVRAAERAARAAGARRRPRRGPSPPLAERARTAAERVTGTQARIAAGRLELPFADERELAELVEALERAERALSSATLDAAGD